MNAYLTYGIIFVILLALELCYFKVADHFNIIDKPNERSSHSTIVLRGGGIIFLISVWIWGAFFGFQYPWFLVGLTLVASISFVDDIHSLPDSVRLVAQFAAAAMAFYQLGILHWSMWWIILLALIVYVGATNVINFMDGINGITAGYSLAVLIPLALVNINGVFVEQSLIISTVLASLVFCIFNFRPKGKAKCFAGDVGSIGIAFIILFLLSSEISGMGWGALSQMGFIDWNQYCKNGRCYSYIQTSGTTELPCLYGFIKTERQIFCRSIGTGLRGSIEF